MEISAFHPSKCVTSDGIRSRSLGCSPLAPWAKTARAHTISPFLLSFFLIFFFSDLTVTPSKKWQRGNSGC